MNDMEMLVQNGLYSRESLPRDGVCSSTLLIQAIRDKKIDMLKTLLESDSNVTGCALIHAIQHNSSTAVRLICEHLHSKLALEVQINAFADEDGFLRYTTPLLYASTENQIDIVKMLIEFGAEFPRVKAMISRAGSEQYDRNLARLHYCRAISSEAYLLATPDPLESAFEAGKIVKYCQRIRMGSLGKEFSVIKNNLDVFSSNILMKADSIEEMRLLVCGGCNDNEMLTKRVEEALELSYKQFLVSPTCQQYILEKWYSGIIDWQHMSRFAFMLCTMMVMIFNPVLSLLYILIPFDFVQNNIRAPYMRYLSNFTFNAEFVCVLLYYTVGLVSVDSALDAEHRASDPEYITIIIYIMIAGMTMREINEVLSTGVWGYLGDWFNWVDICQLILYWISISLNIYDTIDYKIIVSQRLEDNFTMILPERAHNIDDLPVNWHIIDIVLIAEAAFAIANVLTFLAILHDVVILSFVGPLLVSFVGMFADIGRFVLIFLCVWVSFGIGLTQLYQTLGEIEDDYCIDCEPLEFATLLGTLQVLFWSVFDLTDLYNFRQYQNLFATEAVGVFLYACYMVMVSIVLVNALIAMMNNTYNRVEIHSDVEWTLSRTQTMASYMSNGQTLAPPFNLIPTVKTIFCLLASPCINICGRKHISTTRKTNTQTPKTQENGFDTENNVQDDKYQVLIRQVTKRYVDELGLTSKEEQDGDQIKSKLDQLQESIDLMREELKQVQRERAHALNHVCTCRLTLDAESSNREGLNGVPADRPIARTIDKPKDRPIDRPTARPINRPIDSLPVRPIYRLRDRPIIDTGIVDDPTSCIWQ